LTVYQAAVNLTESSSHAGLQELHVPAMPGYLLEDLLQCLPSSRLEVYPVW
jgi:hypothetical protein